MIKSDPGEEGGIMVQGQTPGLPQARKPESEPGVNIPENVIREELVRILSGHEFRSSKRSQEFLRYVVENTLGGHSEILKERTIGIEVFGRTASYDPSEDATVRVKAGEVRKRLGMYYAAEGLHNPVRIELPAGTYIPEFRGNGVAHAESAPAGTGLGPVLIPTAATTRKWILWSAIAGVFIVFAAGIWIWRTGQTSSAPIDQFWAPVLQGSAPVSVCASYVPLLGRDPNSNQLGLTLFTDQFVGGGDLIAVSRLSSLLTRRQRPFHVRIGNEISLYDLESAPAIMVGYSHTQWKEISSELRYFIDASRNPVGITDHGAPTKWTLLNLAADRHTSEDYAIVSRVFHPSTHAMLIELAGITQYGTDAASDLVTNPELMAEALRGAPRDWPKKNLQLVLHVKVISGAPSSPRVVATHFW